MKNRLKILATLILVTSCQLNWYRDEDLGSGFYYMVEPAYNSIVIPVNPDNPYKSSIFVIKDVESVGLNKKYVFVTSMGEKGVEYWWIDKTVETEKLGYGEGSIMRLSNVKDIDSADFNQMVLLENIELKTKEEYRKKLGYD